VRALRAGAVGFLPKSSEPADLPPPLLAALDGWSVLPAEVLAALAGDAAGDRLVVELKDGERHLLRLIAGGSCSVETADRLHLSDRVPGKYKDMIMDIATEEIGHVEMLTTMLARLLEGGPAEATEKAAAANPLLAAVLGGMNPQHAIVAGGGPMPTNSQGVPWNAGYIVAGGNLLADFRSNVAAEAQSRLQTSRIYTMTDDRGVKVVNKIKGALD
jgi:hypothetical protein